MTATRQIAADVRLVRVRDAAVVASASGRAAPARLDGLARSLSKELSTTRLPDGAKVAVVTFRNRSETRAGKATASELADKLSGALQAAGTWRMHERIDLSKVLDEKDFALSQGNSAKLLAKPEMQRRLAGVDYLVVGAVSLVESR